MSGPLDSLVAIHRALKELAIGHALIGGWAAVAWGVVRATKDIDFLAAIPQAKRDAVSQGLSALGYQPEWRRGGLDDPIGLLLRLASDAPEGYGVDLIVASRPFEEAALSRSRVIQLDGRDLPVLAPEDLIALKLRAGGGVDFQDVQSILNVQGDRLDIELLESSCSILRVSSLLKKIRASR